MKKSFQGYSHPPPSAKVNWSSQATLEGRREDTGVTPPSPAPLNQALLRLSKVLGVLRPPEPHTELTRVSV